MDKILGYVLDNLKQLTPFHLLLVLLLTLLASTAIFFVFKWLFTSRFEAQRELLQLKSDQVAELKARFAELKAEGTQLSEELAQAKGSLAKPAADTANRVTLSLLRVRITIVALMWLHTMQQLRVSLWSILAIYAEVEPLFRGQISSAPPAEQLRERLEQVTAPFNTVDFSPDAFARFEPAIEGDPTAPHPSGLMEFPFNETTEALEGLREDISGALDALFHRMEAKQLPSA